MKNKKLPKKHVRVIKHNVVRAFLSGKNASEIARMTGYTGNQPAVRGYEILHHPTTQAAIQAALDRAGADADFAAGELIRGIKEGRLDSHGFYLDRLLRVRKWLKHDETPSVQVNVQQLQGIYRAWVDAGVETK